MKINMDQKPEKKQAANKSGPKKKSPAPGKKPEDSGNVYVEGLKMYRDKWKAQMHGGGIFRQNKFWIITATVLFVVFLAVNSKTSNTRTQLTVQLKRTATETTNLNNAIADVKADLEEQARIDSVKLTEDEEELARNNAIEQGVTVANLQNAYRHLDLATDREAFKNNKNSLDICFGDNDKNARVEWYSSRNGIPGTWEFASKAPFKGNTAKVLWLCYADEDHTLLSYCTAKYNADTKLFTDVSWKMTGYAAANIGTDGEVVDTEHITSVQDALRQLAGEGEIPVADDELDEDTIGINNEISEGRSAYKDAVANGDVEGEEFDDNYNVGLDGSQNSDESSDGR